MAQIKDIADIEILPAEIFERIVIYLPAESALSLQKSSSILQGTLEIAFTGPKGQNVWRDLYEAEYDDVWTKKLLSSFNDLDDDKWNKMRELFGDGNWINLYRISLIGKKKLFSGKLVQTDLKEIERNIKSELVITYSPKLSDEVPLRFTIPFANSFINVLSPEKHQYGNCYVIYKDMSSAAKKRFIKATTSVLGVKTFTLLDDKKHFQLPTVIDIIALLSIEQVELVQMHNGKSTVIIFPPRCSTVCDDMAPPISIHGNLMGIWANEVNIMIYKLHIDKDSSLEYTLLTHYTETQFVRRELVQFWNEMTQIPHLWFPIIDVDKDFGDKAMSLAFSSSIQDPKNFRITSWHKNPISIPNYNCEYINLGIYREFRLKSDLMSVRSTSAEGIYIMYTGTVLSYSEDAKIWLFHRLDDWNPIETLSKRDNSVVAIISKNLIIRTVCSNHCYIFSIGMEKYPGEMKTLRLGIINHILLNIEVPGRIMIMKDAHFYFECGVPYVLFYFEDKQDVKSGTAWTFKKISFGNEDPPDLLKLTI